MNRISVAKILLEIFTVLGLMLLITAFGPQGCENMEMAASSTKGSSLTQSTTSDSGSSVSSSSTSSSETVGQAVAYLAEADSLYAGGDFYKALRAYKRVLTVDPTNAEVKEKIARLEELIAEYETHYNLGMELWYQQNYSEALKELEKALVLYPTSEMVKDHIKTLKQILGIS